MYFYIHSSEILKETFTATYDGVFSLNTLSETKISNFTPLSETTNIPAPFICEYRPPPGQITVISKEHDLITCESKAHAVSEF